MLTARIQARDLVFLKKSFTNSFMSLGFMTWLRGMWSQHTSLSRSLPIFTSRNLTISTSPLVWFSGRWSVTGAQNQAKPQSYFLGKLYEWCLDFSVQVARYNAKRDITLKAITQRGVTLRTVTQQGTTLKAITKRGIRATTQQCITLQVIALKDISSGYSFECSVKLLRDEFERCAFQRCFAMS